MFILCLHENHDDIYIPISIYLIMNSSSFSFSTGQAGIVCQQMHSFVNLIIQQVFIEHLPCASSWVWFNVSMDSSCPDLLTPLTILNLSIHHLLEQLICYDHVSFFLIFQKHFFFLRSRHGTRTKTSSLMAWCPLHASLQVPILGWVMPSQILISLICLLERQNGTLVIRGSLHE